MLGIATPAMADITHKMQFSIQLSVDGASSVANRIGSTYSVSGNNITLDTAGGLGTLIAGAAVGFTAADYSITTAGYVHNRPTYLLSDWIQTGERTSHGRIFAILISADLIFISLIPAPISGISVILRRRRQTQADSFLLQI